MSKKQDINQFCDSQEAIRKYIQFVESKGAFAGHHKARVLISKRNFDFNKILEIGTLIETNNSLVIICGDDEFCRDFHTQYTNEYQVFEYMSPGMLLVKDTEDIWGNKIEIDISFYE